MKKNLLDWLKHGPFVYTPNHPKPFVISSMALSVVRKLGISSSTPDVSDLISDPFRELVVWPVYPEIAETLGLSGSYNFKLWEGHPLAVNKNIMDLEAYIAGCYESYSKYDRTDFSFSRLKDPRFENIHSISIRSETRSAANPYRNLPPVKFWSRSVANIPMNEVTPTARAKFTIASSESIAAAGSCFAQHISKELENRKLNFVRTDAELPAGVRKDIYDLGSIFSARFGNIYSSRQFLQLLQRAVNETGLNDLIWEDKNGNFLDGFRPRIVDGGFISREELIDDRIRHLAATRKAIRQADVFVFTLGMTEIWRSKTNGWVAPIAPGVVTSASVQEDFEYYNLSVSEVVSDFCEAVALLRDLKPNIKMIITVSPVPLAATYSDAHVLSATTYSKSVLRVAAQHIADSDMNIEYFPSYEIITGSFNRGTYFSDDLREVKDAGVNHVMRVFFDYFYANGNFLYIENQATKLRIFTRT
ncbi:GSCFA domain-containing protein [Methylobacterium nonmethylotrophicum]|uniref:GSCFA domain-containing protein n=1 Tax=Methylobacterium nonmethylotrophicum TaxID=1141884 RepID=A0A4Z0NH86_9HYPH|nr:GSCFA domain-containing protein [Methylobacterium nonmethylotrophicum]TGD95030.1 hypothetical protein EU555_29735 [Methylobacterium nonmethylotrophicum]